VVALLAFPLAACASSDGDEAAPEESVVDASVVETEPADGGEPTTEPDTDAAPTGSEKEDPCVLSGADVTSVMGGTYDDGEINTELSSSPVFYCQYTSTETGEPALVVTLIAPNGFSIADQRPTHESVSSDVVDATVAGADSAYTVDQTTVLAQVGDYGFVVQNFEVSGDDPAADVLALAALAVANFD